MNYDLTEYEVEDDIVRQSINNKRRGRRGGWRRSPSIAKLRGFATSDARARRPPHAHGYMRERPTGQIGSFRLAVFASTVPLAHVRQLACSTTRRTRCDRRTHFRLRGAFGSASATPTDDREGLKAAIAPRRRALSRAGFHYCGVGWKVQGRRSV